MCILFFLISIFLLPYITIRMLPSVSRDWPMKSRMLGWRRRQCMAASCSKACCASISECWAFLTATGVPLRAAFQTSPYAPLPSLDSRCSCCRTIWGTGARVEVAEDGMEKQLWIIQQSKSGLTYFEIAELDSIPLSASVSLLAKFLPCNKICYECSCTRTTKWSTSSSRLLESALEDAVLDAAGLSVWNVTLKWVTINEFLFFFYCPVPVSLWLFLCK